VPNKSIMEAVEGDVLLTTEGPGHAALIIGFQGWQDMGTYLAPQYIVVQETNYVKCTPGTRLIHWNDPEIRGVIHTSEMTTS
jgi:hypothetical protein